MVNRCRVQHRWTEQISLFIGILSYVLSYNFSFCIGQSYIKHFTIKRANDVYRVIRWYTTEKGHGIQFCDKIKGIKIT